MSFTANIPTAQQTLGNSRQSIVNNFSILRSTLAIDHVDVNSANNGYHKVIHYQNQGSNPSTVAGVGQLYTRTIDGDQNLVYKSGGGTVFQMTGADFSGNGYAWTGGLLLQWGQTTITNLDEKAVTFPTPFPTNLFTVQVTYSVSDNSSIRSGIKSGTTTNSGFRWIGTSSSATTTLRWFAVGN